MARSTAWPSRATSRGSSSSRGRAPARARRRPRSQATSSTSRTATSARPSFCPPRSLSRTKKRRCARTKADITFVYPSTTGPAPSPASRRAWRSSAFRIESIVQKREAPDLPGFGRPGAEGEPTPVVMITHRTREDLLRCALEAIVQDRPCRGRASDDTH